MSIKLGITGGIGSGKSVVSRLLQLCGVPVYISDDEAKQLTATDEIIRSQLIDLLGEEVYANGQLNKPLLANYLFANAEHANRVNGIIHPRVKAHFQEWCMAHKEAPIVAMESAILIEAGFVGEVDRIVSVYAPNEIRMKRAMQRDGATRQQIEQRMQRQMSDEAKREVAHFTIINDGETLLIPQVLELIASLSQKD